MKMPKILFFIRGSIPNKQAMALAAKYGGNVAFRNADRLGKTNALEQCSGVAGLEESDIPVQYREAFPTAEEALKEHAKQFEITEEDDVNSFDLPDISAGAKKLIAEYEISDEDVKSIKGTGKGDGIVKSDVEAYLDSLAEEQDESNSEESSQTSAGWTPNA